MGYDISLCRDNQPVEVSAQNFGTFRCVGGSTEAEVTITYNYAEVTKLVAFNFSDLDKLTGAESIPILEEVVAKLGTRRFGRSVKAYHPLGVAEEADIDYDTYYWCPTPGNAGYAANQLLQWAKQHPDAVWEVA